MQQEQKQLVSFSQAHGLTIIIICCVNRTVQLWSRALGTTGPYFYGWMLPIGLVIQNWCVAVNASQANVPETIDLTILCTLSIVWMCVHGVVRTVYSVRGLQLHSYEAGSGVLNWLFRSTSTTTANLLSDLSIAVFLSTIFRVAGSPALSNWYSSMVLWISLAHTWSWFTERRRMQMWVDAKSEAAQWSHRIGD